MALHVKFHTWKKKETLAVCSKQIRALCVKL